MPFTDNEIAEHTLTIEKHFWSKRRPPVEMRDKIREGQRFTGYTLDLFYVRPRWQHPGETIDSPVARGSATSNHANSGNFTGCAPT